MRCACGTPGCKNELIITREGIWVRHEKLGEMELLLYVDANALLKLICEARQAANALYSGGSP